MKFILAKTTHRMSKPAGTVIETVLKTIFILLGGSSAIR